MNRQNTLTEAAPELPLGHRIRHQMFTAVIRAEDTVGKLEAHLAPVREQYPIGSVDCDDMPPSTAEYFSDIHSCSVRVNAVCRRLEELIDEIKL